MSDNLIVNRNNTIYQVDMENLRSIEDTDLLLVNRNGTTYTITGDRVGGGQVNNLNPAIPPFISKSGPEVTVTNSDGKVEFSLDGTSWQSSLTIPSETVYYCDWTDDILSAAHDSTYETSINVDYTNLNTTQDIELALKIDKLPDPFTFDVRNNQDVNTEIVSNTISPLFTINAPTSVWGTTTATDPEIAIADKAFETIPSSPGTLYVNKGDRIRIRHTTGGTPLTTYATTLNIGYGVGVGEFETSTFSTTSSANSINKPSIISINDGDVDISVSPTILASAFDPEGATNQHDSTTWQIASDASFASMVQEETSTTALTTFKTAQLAESTSYYVRVKYFGSTNGSTPLETEWSDAVEFTTYATIPPGNFDHGAKQTTSTEVWTVPEQYTRIRVTVASGRIQSTAGVYSYGQIVTGEFDVIPGEQFKLGGFAQSRYIGQNLELSQSMLMVVSGGAGMNGSKRDHINGLENKSSGGVGGSPSPGGNGGGFRGSQGGKGGTLTGPGDPGEWQLDISNGQLSGATGGDPDGLYGGGRGSNGTQNGWGNTGYGGTGGSGWFGGGGGPAEYTGEGGGGGGGGSSNWNITGRNSSNISYSTASSSNYSYTKIEW